MRKTSAPTSQKATDLKKTATGTAEQTEIYEKAISLFQAGEFARARDLFEAAAGGPQRAMAHSARIHARICEQKMNRATLQPKTAEEHYELAVTLLNRRELDAAERHLLEALRQAPEADHVHYALALTYGLRGNMEASYEHLKRAIELNPRNRAQALNDSDFAPFIQRHPLASLLVQKEKRSDR